MQTLTRITFVSSFLSFSIVVAVAQCEALFAHFIVAISTFIFAGLDTFMLLSRALSVFSMLMENETNEGGDSRSYDNADEGCDCA